MLCNFKWLCTVHQTKNNWNLSSYLSYSLPKSKTNVTNNHNTTTNKSISLYQISLVYESRQPPEYEATNWQSGWRRHVSWQQYRAPECKSCSLCSERKTCFVLNQKALPGFPILLWLRISVAAVPGARPLAPTTLPNSKPPPHYTLSFLSISNPEGEVLLKTNNNKQKTKVGRVRAEGGAEGELLCEIIARNNFKQMSVWTWPWARVPVKYSDLIGKQAVWGGLAASRTIRGLSNDPRGSRGRRSKSRSERMWGRQPGQGP